MQMDICSHIGLSVTEVTSLRGLCVDTLESTYGVLGDFSMDELGYGVTKFLNIHDDTEEVSGPIFQTGNVFEEAHQSEITTGAPENHFSKCATFSCSSKTLSSAAASVGGALKGEMNDYADDITNEIPTRDDDSETVNPDCSDSLSTPCPSKPIAAMKGSREKHGLTPPNKLTVKWAPDVYDPVPTSVSHMVTNTNRPRKQSKKKSKNKQKNGSNNNKSSRGGSKSKEKQHVRKRDNTGFKFFEQKEEIISFSEIQSSAMDFHVGIPDLFCGSSFVNGYGSSFHLSSVAEAT